MKKFPFFSILLLVLILNLFSISAPRVSALENDDVVVMTFIHTWYNTSDGVSWSYPKIIDTPIWGMYNSTNTTIIYNQFKLMSECGIDASIISFMGIYNSDDSLSGSAEATINMFQVVGNNSINVKLVVMVDLYNETEGGYDLPEIYNWVYSELYTKYPSVYYCEDTGSGVGFRPVLYLYNSAYLTGDPTANYTSDSRFITKTIGHRTYCDFWYENIRDNFHSPREPMYEQVSVLPRFDDRWRTPPTGRIDVKLDYLYNEQWENAIEFAKDDKIRYITIATWNEYPERTMIEPHIDPTARNQDPYYLCNMTKYWIERLRGENPIMPYTIQEDSITWYKDPKVVLAFLAGAFLLLYMLRRMIR